MAGLAAVCPLHAEGSSLDCMVAVVEEGHTRIADDCKEVGIADPLHPLVDSMDYTGAGS